MRELSYSEAIREAMSEEMRRDPEVFLMGEDVATFGGVWGVSAGMLEEFGEDRIRDTPISEAAIVGAGLGSAMMGMRPIVEIMFGDFLMCAGDQIVNQVAKARFMSGGKAKVPLTIRVTTGAPGSAAAQHSKSPESWFMNVPGIKILIPSTPADAKGLLKTAVRGQDPTLFFEHKMLYGDVADVPEDPDFMVPFGQANVLREGSDVTIIGINIMVKAAMEAAETLAGEGIQAEVIDPRTLVPLDIETITESVKKTSRLVVADEGYSPCGIGAEIIARVQEEAFDYLDAPMRRVHTLSAPSPYAPTLEKALVPDVQEIVDAVKATL